MESKVSYTNSTKSALDLFKLLLICYSFYSKIKVSTVNSNTMTVKDLTLSFCSRDLHSSITGKWRMPRLRRTDLIDLSTGLRKSQSRRMELSKEKSGKAHPAILEIGEIIARRDSVSSFILKEINTKVCGQWIKNMAKELTGDMKLVNSEENIQVIGLKTKSTEEEHFSLRTVIVMTDIGLMACHKEKEE